MLSDFSVHGTTTIRTIRTGNVLDQNAGIDGSHDEKTTYMY